MTAAPRLAAPALHLLPTHLPLRLATGFALLLTIAPITRPSAALAALALVALLLAATRHPLPWRRLIHLEAFLILLFLTLPFSAEGPALFTLGPLTATTAGLTLALTLALKVTASVLLLHALTAATPPEAIGAALRTLRLPEPLIRIFLSLTRYLALIRAEMDRAREAMRARSFTPRTNLHSFRTFGHLIGMMLIRAMERADRVEEAMRLRGYAGRMPGRETPPPNTADIARATALIAAFLALTLWGRS